MADIDDTVEAEVTSPRHVTADGVTVTQPSIADQIKLANWADSKDAARKTGYLGIRLQKIKPPAADD